MSFRCFVSGPIARTFPLLFMALLTASTVTFAADDDQKSGRRRTSKSRTRTNVAQTVEGKITAIEKKGRTFLVSIEDEKGEKSEHRLTSKTPVQVTGAGDRGFMQPGAVVYTEAYVKEIKNKQNPNQQNRNFRNRNNGQPSRRLYFGKSFKVYLSRSPQPGWNKKGNEVQEFIGQIVQKTDKEVVLNLGRAGRVNVTLEEGYKVEIVSNDLGLISEGAEVVLHGRPARGRFKVNSAEIKLDKTLKSLEYFASNKGAKKRGDKRVAAKKRDRSRTRRSRKSDKQGESAAGKKKTTDSVPNPFADLDKKSEGKSKQDGEK